jgi:hypothetical protein
MNRLATIICLCIATFPLFAQQSLKIICKHDAKTNHAIFQLNTIYNPEPIVNRNKEKQPQPFLSYVWDFGDGSIEMPTQELNKTGNIPKPVEHLYSKAGKYVVRCYINYHYASNAETNVQSFPLIINGKTTGVYDEPKQEMIKKHEKQVAVSMYNLPIIVEYKLLPSQKNAYMYVFVEESGGLPIFYDIENALDKRKDIKYMDYKEVSPSVLKNLSKKDKAALYKVERKNKEIKAYQIELSNDNRIGTDFHRLVLPFMVKSRTKMKDESSETYIVALIADENNAITSFIASPAIPLRQSHDPNLINVSPLELTDLYPEQQRQHFHVDFENKGNALVRNVFIQIQVPSYTDTARLSIDKIKCENDSFDISKVAKSFEWHYDSLFLNLTLNKIKLNGRKEDGVIRRDCQGSIDFSLYSLKKRTIYSNRTLKNDANRVFTTRANIRFDENVVIKTPRVRIGLESDRRTLALRTIGSFGFSATDSTSVIFSEYGADVSYLTRLASHHGYHEYGAGVRRYEANQEQELNANLRQITRNGLYSPIIYNRKSQVIHLFYEYHDNETSWLELGTGLSLTAHVLSTGRTGKAQLDAQRPFGIFAPPPFLDGSREYTAYAWDTIPGYQAQYQTLKQVAQISIYGMTAVSLFTRRSHIRLGINAGVRTQAPNLATVKSEQAAWFGSIFLKYRLVR